MPEMIRKAINAQSALPDTIEAPIQSTISWEIFCST